jgi:hypothetical protein
MSTIKRMAQSITGENEKCVPTVYPRTYCLEVFTLVEDISTSRRKLWLQQWYSAVPVGFGFRKVNLPGTDCSTFPREFQHCSQIQFHCITDPLGQASQSRISAACFVMRPHLGVGAELVKDRNYNCGLFFFFFSISRKANKWKSCC